MEGIFRKKVIPSGPPEPSFLEALLSAAASFIRTRAYLYYTRGLGIHLRTTPPHRSACFQDQRMSRVPAHRFPTKKTLFSIKIIQKIFLDPNPNPRSSGGPSDGRKPGEQVSTNWNRKILKHSPRKKYSSQFQGRVLWNGSFSHHRVVSSAGHDAAAAII